LVVAALAGGVLFAPEAKGDGAPPGLPALIPRELLVPEPDRMQSVQLSPDGEWISYLAPDANGVPQLWLAAADGSGARQCSEVAAPGASSPSWAPNGLSILYQQREGSRQRLVSYDVETSRGRDLIALDGARIEKLLASAAVPGQVLVAVRLSETAEADVHRLDLESGRFALDTRNPGGVSGGDFFADSRLCVRAASRLTVDGGTELLVRDAPGASWRGWLRADPTHSLRIEAFARGDRALLLRSDLASETASLVERRISDGRERMVAMSSELDVETVLRHPRTGAVQAVSFLTDPRHWRVLDASLRPDFERLAAKLGPGQLGIRSRDLADSRWLVWNGGDRTSARTLLWDRSTGTARLIHDPQPELASLPLATTEPVVVPSRDGLALHCYLTLPPGVPPSRVPLVVWVHGGPYLRDSWGYDRTAQLFANRGYAFLRVNFRGSRGFGRVFRVAGHKEWGGRMVDDVEDATRWVVAQGIADPKRLAVLGHSYGGYAALVALTRVPGLFACGAASSTAADLVAFANHLPRTPENSWVQRTVGDTAIPADVQRLRDMSPLHHVDRLSGPIVLARGEKDGALPPGEQEAFVDALERHGKTVSYVVYQGDGHFFSRANELDYFARVETLFARCLGGRSEPLPGDRYPGSTARVRNVGRPDAAADVADGSEERR
jgi:dipeptidyl aminopeptidase/acylaminoacyl peptidase